MPRPPSAVPEPSDADQRRAAQLVVAYPDDALAPPDLALYGAALASAELVEVATVRAACRFRQGASCASSRWRGRRWAT